MYYVELCDDINLSELPSLLERLPEWRRQRALRFRFEIDSFLCAKSYLMLCALLTEHYNITEPPEFIYGKNGKPYLKDILNIHFNISHCKNGVLCAVSDSEIGCDIESIGEPPSRELLNRCCNLEEQKLILCDDKPEISFIQLWTQKEAFLKLTGSGLTSQLQDLLAQSKGSIDFRSEICNEKSFIWTICTFKNLRK